MTEAELKARLDAIVEEETEAALKDIQEYIDSGDLDRDIEKERAEWEKKNKNT